MFSESDTVSAASAVPMSTMPPVASVPSDDWLSTIDDPVLRERIRYLHMCELIEILESVYQKKNFSDI